MKTQKANMKKLTISIIVPAIFLLGGCQNMLKTMVAHIRIDSTQTKDLANVNALSNYCLSRNMMDKQKAYDFSTVAAEFLDLVVYDFDFYKNTYERTISMAYENGNKSSLESTADFCKTLEEKLPRYTTELTSLYRNYAQQLGTSRSAENQRLAQSMSNFSVPSTPLPQMNFPNVNFSQEKSPTQNFLINTKSGLTQCRVTSGNFVFCL